MKTILKLATLTLVLAVSGCVSTNETSGKGEQALVCPQCKMVAVTVKGAYFGNAGRGTYGSYGGTKTVYSDACPGCQGTIETFFREGRLQHKCSVCKDTPFTCPIFHPSTH